jgi:putative MATE family efflux protein
MRLTADHSVSTMRLMLRLALPALAEQLLSSMVMLVDVWLTGHYLRDSPYLAAISLMAYTLWGLNCLFEFVSIGATALVARFVGAGELDQARKVVHQSLIAGLCIALPATVIAWFAAPAFVAIMQLEGRAAELAVRYLQIIAPSLTAIMVTRIGAACLRGAGDTAGSMLAMGLVNIVNAALGVMLVIGVGTRSLGWSGLAIATVSGYVAGMTAMLLMFRAGRAGLRLQLSWLTPDPVLMRRILRIGVPGGVDVMLIIICHLWFVSLINRFGDLAAAAHGVGVRIESLAYMPGAAFQIAAGALAGQFLGAGNPRRAGRSVLAACLTGCAVMTVVGAVFQFAGGSLASIFISANQPELIRTTANLLWIVSWGMPLLALQMILTGALRGAGDTRWPMIFSVVGFLGFRLPLTYYVIGYTRWGVEGAWWAMVTDLAVRCALVTWRFFHGGWKHVSV